MAGRKRGGQAGNQNARTHGFYAKHFLAAETGDLEAMTDVGVQGENEMV